MALGAVVVLAAASFLGVRSATVETRLSDGTTIEVRYGQVTRPGLATPWSVTVHRPGGFDGPVTIRTDAAYLEIFDENGLHPDPASSTRDGAELVWEFDTPPGDTFVLALDARIEPGVQWGREGRTSVDVGAGVGEVTYRTWVLP
jgi:hypothetical protein